MTQTNASAPPAPASVPVDFRAEPTMLEVRSLSVTFGEPGVARPAVNDVSFRIARGERVAIVGESGSGKTTLALAIAGFLIGESTHLTYDLVGFDGHAVERHVNRGLPVKTPGVTMVFQDAMTSLDPVWTIGSQLRAVLQKSERLSRRAVAPRMEYWLDRVGLTDSRRVLDARPYELSGGMRQRAMLAIALCSRPRLMIADEPTSALDASLAREIMDLMVELTEDFGTSLLMVSHDIHLCQEYADRIVVMLNGDLVDDVEAARIDQDATHPYTRGLVECVPTLDSAGLDELPTLAAIRAGGAW